MERYPIEELKLIYRVLHRQLAQNTELLDAQFFDDLQKYLQKQAVFDGVDIGDRSAWDGWLGNDMIGYSVRVQGRAVIG
jgi:hypothetical protein